MFKVYHDHLSPYYEVIIKKLSVLPAIIGE
jgi:hypothetical protein